VLNNCTIVSNIGTAYPGGVYHSTLTNCIVAGNEGGLGCGGAVNSTLVGCIVVGNSGGGVWGDTPGESTLLSCTVASNTLGYAGVTGSTLYNCIVYDNTPRNYDSNSCYFTDCCTIPLPPSVSSYDVITNDPAFLNTAGADFHLQPWSRCINAGENEFLDEATDRDLDGNPRIRGGTVDMGAYEFQAQVTGSFADWLQQYGLPTDGSADGADADKDGMVNGQEWIAGTNPTNALSVLKLQTPDLSNSNGVVIGWPGVTNRIYSIQRNADLTSPFSTLQDGIAGQSGSMSYTDTTATVSATLFYRMGVQ
jgi:hypothetical protein